MLDDLLAALEDPGRRIEAARELGELRDAAATPRLVKVLQGDGPSAHPSPGSDDR